MPNSGVTRYSLLLFGVDHEWSELGVEVNLGNHSNEHLNGDLELRLHEHRHIAILIAGANLNPVIGRLQVPARLIKLGPIGDDILILAGDQVNEPHSLGIGWVIFKFLIELLDHLLTTVKGKVNIMFTIVVGDFPKPLLHEVVAFSGEFLRGILDGIALGEGEARGLHALGLGLWVRLLHTLIVEHLLVVLGVLVVGLGVGGRCGVLGWRVDRVAGLLVGLQRRRRVLLQRTRVSLLHGKVLLSWIGDALPRWMGLELRRRWILNILLRHGIDLP